MKKLCKSASIGTVLCGVMLSALVACGGSGSGSGSSSGSSSSSSSSSSNSSNSSSSSSSSASSTSGAWEPVADNLLDNGDAELGLDPWLARGAAQVSLDNTQAHDGNNSIWVTGRAEAWHGVSYPIANLTAGNTYQFYAWVKLAPGESDTSAQITVQYEDSEGWKYPPVKSAIVTANGWTEIKGSYLHNPAGAASGIQVYVESESPTASYFVDDLAFTGEVVIPQSTVTSPNGDIQADVFVENGALKYSIKHKGQTVLRPSKLGLSLEGDNFTSNLSLTQTSDVGTVEQTYRLRHGKQSSVTYIANEKRYSVINSNQQRMEVVFRASDDGVAFRYRILDDADNYVTFQDEITSFAFPSGAKAWLQPIAIAETGYEGTNPSYEEGYQMDIPVGTSAPSSSRGWVFPALFRVGETWVAITEAAMDGTFHASRLEAASPGGEYAIGLPTAPEVAAGGDLLAQGPLPFESPWRVITLGSLGTLVESTLGTDLADPEIAPMDFVEPGFSSWSWAMLGDSATNYDTQRQFIDFAANMKWPYALIDAFWDANIGRQRIAELASYAASKDVGLLLWYNSAGDWNTTPQTPKNIMSDPVRRQQEFAWLKQIGIKGLKIDFFAGDGKSMMEYYNDLAREAADYDLMLNYHGSSLPRGLHRTYPNIMTMEAIRGFEMIKFSQGVADAAPAHMAVTPFTRNLFDPMDFTPTIFSNINGIERSTSNGYELALTVIFLSGWQHIVEVPAGMAAVPEYVRQILGEIPVLWDETRFIEGFPGQYAVIARRKGNTWYVAGINGQNQTRNITMNLDFVSNKTGRIITDGQNSREFTTNQVSATNSTNVSMRPHGGFLLKF